MDDGSRSWDVTNIRPVRITICPMTTLTFISRVVKPRASSRQFNPRHGFTTANNLIVTEATGQVFCLVDRLLDYTLATLRVSYGYHASSEANFERESITRIVITLNIYTYMLACRSLPSGAAPAHAFRSDSLPK